MVTCIGDFGRHQHALLPRIPKTPLNSHDQIVNLRVWRPQSVFHGDAMTRIEAMAMQSAVLALRNRPINRPMKTLKCMVSYGCRRIAANQIAIGAVEKACFGRNFGAFLRHLSRPPGLFQAAARDLRTICQFLNIHTWGKGSAASSGCRGLDITYMSIGVRRFNRRVLLEFR